MTKLRGLKWLQTRRCTKSTDEINFPGHLYYPLNLCSQPMQTSGLHMKQKDEKSPTMETPGVLSTATELPEIGHFKSALTN